MASRDTPPLSPHQRAAATKKARTRAALVEAARAAFADHGWGGSRLEDIAQAAGVSVPTAYNHFPGGKQELAGVVFAPLLTPLLEEVDADIAAKAEASEAVARHLRRLVELARGSALTMPLLTAAFERVLRVGAPSGPHDVRVLVPLPQGLIKLISYGQEQGRFHPFPTAVDVAVYHVNALLMRLMSRPEEPIDDTVGLAVGQVLAALTAPPPAGHATRHKRR